MTSCEWVRDELVAKCMNECESEMESGDMCFDLNHLRQKRFYWFHPMTEESISWMSNRKRVHTLVWVMICLACHRWVGSVEGCTLVTRRSPHATWWTSFTMPLLKKQFIQLPLALLELIIAHPFWLQGAVGMYSFAPHPSQHHHCFKWLIMELWISFIRALTGFDFKSSPENLLSNCVNFMIVYVSKDYRWDGCICQSWKSVFLRTFHRWHSWYVKILVCRKLSSPMW